MKLSYLYKNPELLHWFAFDVLYRPTTKRLMSVAVYSLGHLLELTGRKRQAMQYLMAAQRYFPATQYALTIKNRLYEMPELYPFMMQDDIDIDNVLSRSIIIKMPTEIGSQIVKGVIIITFTNTNRYFYHHIDIVCLQKYFHVVLEPSSAGYCLPQILFWTMYDEPVFVESTEVTDRMFLKKINTNLVPMKFGQETGLITINFSH